MKKIHVVGFLFGLLLAVALGVHHLAFAQSEASTNSPLLPFFVKTKTPATIPQSVTLPDHRPDSQLSARWPDHHLQESLFFFDPRHQRSLLP